MQASEHQKIAKATNWNSFMHCITCDAAKLLSSSATAKERDISEVNSVSFLMEGLWTHAGPWRPSCRRL